MKNFYFILLTVVFISCAVDRKQQLFKATGNGLGTTYNISYYADEEINLKPSIDSIFEVINASMSTYHKNSDISRLNRGEEVELDEHFINVFNTAKEIQQNTNGYFDPSIGPLVNAYGFGPTRPLDEVGDKAIDSLLTKVGFEKFSIVDSKLQTDIQGYYIDFNAIAKGYTVDVIANHLKAIGLSDYFVELGGEIVARGQNLEKATPWNFGIEKPVENNELRDLTHAIKLENQALATSGNYRKFRVDEVTNQKYVHTINPKTGLAEKSNVLSASVVADNCMTADAYATAFMAMGYEKALDVIKNKSISVLLIFVDEKNDIQYFNTVDINDQINEID
jgi:thiamine biosynthesis lipoprotein